AAARAGLGEAAPQRRGGDALPPRPLIHRSPMAASSPARAAQKIAVAIRRCCVITASSSSQERERGAPPLRLPRACCAKCLKRFEIHHNLSLIPRKKPQG